jgi:RNA:NAD 2'-phosphotransferase (TPT1/KptA family)
MASSIFDSGGGTRGKGGGGRNNHKNSLTKLSKQMSFTLRHGAEKINLKMEEDGYVLVNDLISKPMFKVGVHNNRSEEGEKTGARVKWCRRALLSLSLTHTHTHASPPS